MSHRLRAHGERRTRVQLGHDADAPRRGQGAKLLDDVVDFLGKIRRDWQRFVDTAESRKAKHILDEIMEACRLPIDVPEPPITFRVGLGTAKTQRLDIELDLRQRRAQLVRHARHEVGAETRQLALASQLRDGDDGERRGETKDTEENGQT